MNVDLVYNPAAGSYRAKRLADLRRALERKGAAVREVPSARNWDPANDPPDLVCVHGGDGTLRDAVQALGPMAGEIPLCIAPSGTINLVAREIGYPREPEALAELVFAAWARGPGSWLHAPLYTLGELPVVACLSIGPDSHAVADVSSALKRRIGRLAYGVAMMRLLRRWPQETMTVRGETTDGERFECEAGAVVASHGAHYAGSFRLSPRAALKADSVELIVLRRSSRWATLAFTAAALLRLPLDRLGLADIRSVRRVEFDRCVSPVQVDGDHIPDCAYAIGPSGLSLHYVV
ncbi:diacylglycerol/lipid kinase family protein [Tsuneonella sp. HG249]